MSVILPTFNRAKEINRSVYSILNQTYKDFELIIVDDCSTDCTQEIINEIRDSRIKYIRHETNKGAAAARNTGIKAAQGNLIAFQDSDDEWIPEKLAKQVRVISAMPENVGVVYSGFWKLGKQKKYIPSKNITIKEGMIYNQLLHGNFVGMPVSIIRRECFDTVGGFNEHLRALEDWELFLRISTHFKFKYIDEPLVLSYETDNSVSANVVAHAVAYEYILNNNYSTISKDRELLAQYLYVIGKLNFQVGNQKKGRQYLVEARKTCPLNVKYNIAVLLSFLGKDVFNSVIKLKRFVNIHK